MGQHLPHWLRLAANEAALADLTALEWAVLHAFDAEDVPTLSPNDLATVPAEKWPELRVRLHPSVSLLSVDYNVREVWSALRRSGGVRALKRLSEKLVVWRSSDSVQVEAISSSSHSLLARLAEHSSLSETCEVLATLTAPRDVPTLLSECMHHALARGWISELALPGV